MTTMVSSCQGMPELHLGFRIFISHSGADKTFVRFLAKELRHHWYNVLFDEQSLPKAKEASVESILIQAQKCELALLVLTPEFFTRTRNPMMEVIACVESNVQLLPLFYKLTVDQVKQSGDLYREKWIELNAKANDHFPDIAKWNKAFKKLVDFNGLEYGKKSTNEADFVEEVADSVYRILPPENQRDDTHVVGKERLFEIVELMFDMSPNVEHGVKVLGLHGMEGMGKTTLCEALCNFYLTEFKGRVCHVKLHEGSQHDRINSILLQLGPRSDAYSKRSSIEALKHLEIILSSSMFFLVLDDIQDSYQSDKDEIGRLLLNRIKDIPMGSKLLFLSRRSSALRNVLSLLPESNVSHIHPFPGLNLDEAKLVLCKEFPRLFPDNGMNDPQQIEFLNQCTELCTPTSGSGIYNPLMLKLLASFLVQKWNSIVKAPQGRSKGTPHLTGLKRYLTALKGDRSRGMKEFFDKLQASFNSQIKEYEEPFLDLALFMPGKDAISKQLCLRRDRKVVTEILEKLRDSSFLLDDYRMHDVHRELAKRIARESTEVFYAEHQELKGADLREVVKNNWTRVAFVNCTFRMVKADLDLSRCDNIQVLLLDGNKGLGSVILAVNSPQSIEIRSGTTPRLVHSVAKQEIFEASSSLHNQSFPFSDFRGLAIVELGGIGDSSWSFDAAQLNDCNSLEILQLCNINFQTGTWELPCWPHLRELTLSQLRNLEILSGLERLGILRKLHLSQLNALRSLSNVQSLEKLTAFVLGECKGVSELSLPSSLQHCLIEKCETLRKIYVMCDHEEVDFEYSDEEWVDTENHRLIIKACGNVQEIIGVVDLTSMHSSVYSARERGQPSSFQDFHFRRISTSESWRISNMEFHKSPSTWHLHGLALEEVERNGYVQDQVERNGYVQELGKLLGYAVGLKTLKWLKWVCAKSGFCAIPPKFHLLPSLESPEYHCAHVIDMSTIRQCPRLRSLCVDGCINAQG